MNEQDSAWPSNPMSLAVALSFADSPRRQASLQAPADTIDELYEALRVLAAAVRPAHETNVRQEALQEWRDSCHCGCDACVALIETLALESGAVKANACQCDPNPSIGGSSPCPVHDEESEDAV